MSDAKHTKSSLGRVIVLLAIIIALFLAMRFLPVQQWLRSFNDWVGHMGAAGVFVFIFVYAVATSDDEIVALVTSLINSGQVLLCGNYAGARIELDGGMGAERGSGADPIKKAGEEYPRPTRRCL